MALVVAALAASLLLSSCQRPSSFGEGWTQEQWHAYHRKTMFSGGR